MTAKAAHAGIEARLMGYQRAMERSRSGYDRRYHVRGQASAQARQLLALKPAPTAIFVPVCVSASHIGFGSVRMEPVFMILGELAAIAADLCVQQRCRVQQLPYPDLRGELLEAGQVLNFP